MKFQLTSNFFQDFISQVWRDIKIYFLSSELPRITFTLLGDTDMGAGEGQSSKNPFHLPNI